MSYLPENKLKKHHLRGVFYNICALRYYGVHKIRRYQNTILRYNYNIGILLSTTMKICLQPSKPRQLFTFNLSYVYIHVSALKLLAKCFLLILKLLGTYVIVLHRV